MVEHGVDSLHVIQPQIVVVNARMNPFLNSLVDKLI